MAIAATWSGRRPAQVRKVKAIRIGFTLLACAVLAIGWWRFGPTTLGGSASYVVTSGQSMMPHIRPDGLVITRAESDYRVGDIVAYHNRQLHEVVLHRIVARDGTRYIFKGDNNQSADQYHPIGADLIGKKWVYWAGGGKYMDILRAPLGFGVVLAFIGLLVGRAFVSPAPPRRRRRHGH